MEALAVIRARSDLQGDPRRLIAETLYTGQIRYSVERLRNGEWCYIPQTITHDRAEAFRIWNAVQAGTFPVVSVEVLRQAGAL